MENWEKRYDEMIEKFEGKTVRVTKENGLVKQFISSELESAKQEERERIEKEIIGCMPLFAPKKTMDTVKVFLELIKPVFSLHQNNNKQGGK